MDNRRYLTLLLTITALLVLAAATVNVLIDPYNIFGTTRIDGFNTIKPHAGDRGRIAKLHQVLRAKPRVLIVGNSRPEMGLNPESPCWPVTPVYNLAIPGLTFYKQIRYAQHALAAHDIDVLLLSADFVDFLEPSATRQQAPFWPVRSESARVQVDFDGNRRARWQLERNIDRFRAAVSLEALTDSFTTVLAQRRTHSETRTTQGFFPATGLYMPIVKHEGAVALFTQKNRQFAASLARELTLFADADEWSTEFETLRRFLTQQADATRDVVLYINPYHAEYLLLIEARGLWPAFERWKRELVRLADTFQVPVYDFAVFDDHATELIDSVAARGASLHWFWEPSHYRERLGDEMIATMFPESCPDAKPEFDARLTAANLEQHLTAIRDRRDRFIDENLDVYARLRALAASSE